MNGRRNEVIMPVKANMQYALGNYEQFPKYLAPHFRRRGGGIENAGKTSEGRFKRTRSVRKPRKASQRSGSYKIITNIPGVPGMVL